MIADFRYNKERQNDIDYSNDVDNNDDGDYGSSLNIAGIQIVSISRTM